MRVEVGRPMSTGGGVVQVVRHIRSSGWFKVLVQQLHQAIVKLEGGRFGFTQEVKLLRILLALIAGLAMCYQAEACPEFLQGFRRVANEH